MTTGILQPVLEGELEVPLVVGRNAHDGAGAVVHQGVVGDEDGRLPAVQPVDGADAEKDPRLLLLRGHTLDLRLPPGGFDVSPDFVAPLRGGHGLDQRMLGGQHHEGDSEDGIDSGGEGAQLLLLQPQVGNVEADLHTLAASHPVALHGQDLLGPVQQAGEVQELVGVGGDAQEPLLHVAAGNRRIAPLAPAVHRLLVGQDRLAGRAPHDRRLVSVGQALLQELEEEPLVPPVVLRKTADDLPVPVVDGAHAAELGAHVLDISHGPGVGVYSALHRGVFGGETEGVEPHGVEHVVALHPAKPGVAVGRGHGVPVADVEVARGVGIHGQLIPLGPGIVVGNVVNAVGLPAFLPLPVNLPGPVSYVNHSRRHLHAYPCHATPTSAFPS